jgi:hypothetical protein
MERRKVTSTVPGASFHDMNLTRTSGGALLLAWVAVGLAQQVVINPAPTVTFPAPTDSNSPAVWNGRELLLYNSTGLGPIQSTGPNQFEFWRSQPVILGQSVHRPFWIESAWIDHDGTIFAWYHHEPQGVCNDLPLTAPEIGALLSTDGGVSFMDLGIILQSGYAPDCSSQNGFAAGGHGDFSVVLGRSRKYFYFLFSNYSGPQESQGVAVARLPFERRSNPFGAVQKYYQGDWLEPGIGGSVTAIFPANVIWSRPDADAFWGPSVHWNTHLKSFVMLLNHSCCSPGWPQEGVYISFNPSLANPSGWTTPVKILDGAGWYPQVLGLGPNGTDKQAGKVARLYAGGASSWEIEFED